MNVFEYTDYRSFLRDCYEERKRINFHFSHRMIAQRVGLKSSGHFAQILKEQVNISRSVMKRFAELLKLNKNETEYFESMVCFNQAKTHKERREYFERMNTLRAAKVSILDSSKYELYSKWYYLAIYEYIGLGQFNGDCQLLSKTIIPHISTACAKEAIELLSRLHLIRKRDDSFYEKCEKITSTGYTVNNIAIANFNLAMIDLAKQALDRFPKEQRNISTVTIGVSRAEYLQIVEELRTTRRRILNIANGNDKADRVYQLCFQIFPLTEVPHDK